MQTLLENLPTELIEMIFKYLSGSDIYFSFDNLNNRYRTIVKNYRYFTLNFRLMSKCKFDSIIKYIRPSNIRALTLSNGVETNGQIEFFLSSWKLSEFVNLRYLYLDNIERYMTSLICYDIMKLSKLSILHMNGSRSRGDFLLKNIYQLHQLKYLYIRDFYDCFTDISHLSTFDKLTHIDISCDVENISNVFNLASSLRSVNLNILV